MYLIEKSMIKKILVANRGEIAVRVMRSCREMEITSIAIFSEADRTAKHVLYADEAYCVGPAASKESYLNIEKIIEVAKAAHADAIHPGYGFLSENATFARRCQEEGIIFIGPNPETMEAMGDKIAARIKMIEAGVPVVPGTQDNLKSVEEAIELCNKIGYPVMLKASMGGGGKGMRLIHSAEEVEEAYTTAKSESLSSFGDDTVYLEKFANGSGKSYLLNLMAALRVPSVGEVFLEGKRLTTMRERQKRAWRAGLGLIPSEPVLLNGYTVLEGLVLTAQLLGKSAADAKRNALESASLCGLDPYLNARAESLSVGVKKRVVIARSLVNQPRLILADSPLEGLDDQAQEEFLYICTKLSQVGYPIVMTSSYMLPFEIAALRCVELAGEKK